MQDLTYAIHRLESRVTHLSAYCLTIEPHTPLGRSGAKPIPGKEAAVQYQYIHRALQSAGLNRYELSNFSRSGVECIHNLNTWHDGPYIGLDPAAVGFDGTKRRRNIQDLRGYQETVNTANPPPADVETVSDSTRFFERLMLGLRFESGICLDDSECRRLDAAIHVAGVDRSIIRSDRTFRVDPADLFILDEILVKLYTVLIRGGEPVVGGQR